MSSARLKHIGLLIKDLREERGLSQSAFARKLRTSQSAIARIENGEQNLSTATLSKISAALNRDIIKISDRSLSVRIEGGKKLRGTVITRTSKNGAVALLCASLLNRGKTVLLHMPRIEEVHRVIEVLQSIGVSVCWVGNNVEIVVPGRLSLKNMNGESAERTRSVILLLAPLLAWSNKFILPHPGGCRLGERTVRPHLFALEKFGARIKTRSGDYVVTHRKLKAAEIVLYESGDTATESAILAAAQIPRQSVIKYASANYQVQELCFFLQKLGVEIEGVGTTTLIMRGVSRIECEVHYTLSEDPIESMFFIAAAILTQSRIRINRCPIDFLEIELLKLEKMGFKYAILKRYAASNGHTNLADILTFPSRLRALPEKIEAKPYPGLNIDNLPFFAVIATQAKGTTLIHDWVYENRTVYYKELDKLRAETLLADPHRIYITGPTALKAAEVVSPPALRPAAIILIAMLAAEGVSTLRNIYSINRGYEGVIERLNALGAKIKILRSL
ncbi:MAG: UDP-N-acetylglucosamine 1-carboxyvinyltransferase [Candidatus Taylorbacteria bacterium RIFCSPHIGHO2_02_49_25]|uniref:UDP-N-acetylglucosamine 1-carboxyvinyltransferase n=1 Tax=Candidatus Taylorbacteria bacterium RIFCSPHIGHO2_02_49_25 TaxID=1802305 RepID=A0A1G2MGS9_9BACT|nr:MAG: UDP-N-acetylglucosamine 1-carboxyvinyltransferase [Parcubacteria group bacterium GW2011_GWF2_50_9]OHA20076.1 MAG: UDP-N-acetylglucosamine 1-carboxyvinyltransferase [Candidatus Taylorbacteria bacterium RIFCSPHIGHO2_01_FULL_49_60]OHA22914.1 MAG: UDP-N-acetylglucosamine 1-carboxyvinyltransferase [Candidatus Taylorbacteria bacterium RIFCSPHIGHO2_02_49_25]OHA35473.1 MAG: UDP-N-acetylglucosamine 1-carboxyvinyltransferase [Candidatus Taylorbacteria bacterium RIFCSPLOWO2_01_FULL_50_130]OHA36489